VNPLFIIRSLLRGADGVLVAGCHPGDCHYQEGNYLARRRFALLKSLLEYVGVEEGRVQFAWVSASEGGKFAQLITDVTESVRALGPARRLTQTGAGETPWEMSRK
jgi:coenzyme F420-reducing hydrogenase delta subunit